MLFTLGQGAHNVYSSLNKGPWGGYGYHLFFGDMLNVPKSLALITSFDVFLCILRHGGPIVTYFDNFANQGPWACVVFTDSLMDLFQDVFGFVFLDAPQVGHGKAPIIQSVIQDCEPSRLLPDLPSFVCVCQKVSISEEREDSTHPTILVLDRESVEFFNTWMSLHFHFQIGQTFSFLRQCLPCYLVCF